NADPSCSFDYSTQACTRKCQFRTTAVECSQSDLCSWDEANSVCRITCDQNTLPTTCATDPTCTWLSTRSPACNKKCVILYNNPTSCRSDSYCMWDPTSLTCTQTCTYLPAVACQSNFLCVYSKSATTETCSMLCQYRYQDSASCSADAECFWDNYNSVCQGICGVLNTASQVCLTSDVCQWNSQGCVFKCQFRAVNQSQCNAPNNAQTCEWDQFQNMCVNTCSNYMRELTVTAQMSSCTNDPFCQWLNNTCEKKCSQLTYSQCSSDPTDCQWDSKSGVCRDNCNRISLSATCNLDPMCVWNGANCLKVCNYRWFNDSSCNADSQCMWDPTKSVCVQSCGTIGDMATCQQFTVCMWDTSDTMCRTACPYLSVASCSANPACNV
ncbi:Hypothetical protein, putative, partial [Bodo saltans]